MMKDPRKRSGFWAPRSLPLVYVNMPKSGCTSIKNLLYRMDSGNFLEDPLTIHARRDILLVAQANPDAVFERLKTDLVFTFVRHPLKRAYSCFNEKIHFETKYSFPGIRKCIAERYGARFSRSPSPEEHRHNFKKFLHFAQESFAGENGTRRDPHWCPQTFIVNQASRWRMIDFIGRVESFDAHIAAVLALAGSKCDFEMPRMNEGPPPPYSYDEILDDEIVEFGRKFFANDLKNFGYSL